MSDYEDVLIQVESAWQDGTPEEAAPLVGRLLKVAGQRFGRVSPQYEGALIWYGQIREELGHMAEANVAYSEACEVRARLLGLGDLGRAECLSSYTQKWVDWGRYDLAEALHREALALVRGAVGREHPLSVEYAERLAEFLEELGAADAVVASAPSGGVSAGRA